MVAANVGGGVGIVTSLLIAAHSGWRGSDPPKVKASVDGSFLSEWISEDGMPPCMFYNATFQYVDGLCSHFAVARMSSTTQSDALSRALECASSFDTDCILSPEIGLSVPAAFVYDEENGLKMVMTPKISAMDTERKRVDLHMPDGSRTGVSVLLSNNLTLEYLEGVTRLVKTESMTDSAAYCVQLLRLAFAEDCWKQID